MIFIAFIIVCFLTSAGGEIDEILGSHGRATDFEMAEAFIFDKTEINVISKLQVPQICFRNVTRVMWINV